MTVFLAHAPANRPTAEALEKFLERRGQFVELDDGQTAMRPVMANDALVLLISKDLVFAPTRLRLEQRALDAWAEGRLIVVKLDHGLAPVGLRDLPAIDASFEAQREFKWNEVANAIRAALQPARPGSVGGALDTAAPPPQAPPGPPARKRGGGGARLAFALMLGLTAVAAAALGLWGPSVLGAGAPAAAPMYALAGAALLIALAVLAIGKARRAAPPARAEPSAPPAPTEAQSEAPAATAVFVSYARANSALVLPVIEAARAEGREFWLDQHGIGAGEGWAGEIVRAIRGARGVLIMCSKAAFESDHVKREIYLADRYKRKLLPVFIEKADPPEDFEYFFAGVQSVNLFETPEAERPQALMRALAVA